MLDCGLPFLELFISFVVCNLHRSRHPPTKAVCVALYVCLCACVLGGCCGKVAMPDENRQGRGWKAYGGPVGERGGVFIHFYDQIDKVSGVPSLLGNTATLS